MKELITTQLIKELKDEVEEIYKLPVSMFSAREILTINGFISRLQSKQSEERQNIKTAYEALKEDWDGALFNDSEDYFNQTFKQEQK